MIAIKLILSLPKSPCKGYVLADSWYSAQKMIKAFLKNGFQYVSVLKTNHVIYPQNCRLSQKINRFKNVTILISYLKNAFHNNNSLKTFITTDIHLSDYELLKRYKWRWTIETFFRQNKMELNLNEYQVRGSKSIKSYLIIT